VSLLSNLHQKH